MTHDPRSPSEIERTSNMTGRRLSGDKSRNAFRIDFLFERAHWVRLVTSLREACVAISATLSPARGRDNRRLWL